MINSIQTIILIISAIGILASLLLSLLVGKPNPPGLMMT